MEKESREQLQQNEPGVSQKELRPSADSGTKVTFPSIKKRQSRKKLVSFVVVLIVIGAIGYFIFGEKELIRSPETTSPTPFEEAQISTPTPERVIERGKIKIEILNGTGIAGEAAFLQKELGKLGYIDISVGNAKEGNYETTEVLFSDEVPDAVRSEILDNLKNLYKKGVKEKSIHLSGKDIQIYTGLRPGQSFPPTDTPAPETTSTPTPTSTNSASPTP